MRTTISISDELYQQAKGWLGETSFSEFAGEAIRRLVAQLDRERVARDLEEGYRLEAESPSLDPGWAAFETEGL